LNIVHAVFLPQYSSIPTFHYSNCGAKFVFEVGIVLVQDLKNGLFQVLSMVVGRGDNRDLGIFTLTVRFIHFLLTSNFVYLVTEFKNLSPAPPGLLNSRL